MPQLAFTKMLMKEYGGLPKSVHKGVLQAMDKFQQLTVPELHADKGLHLEDIEQAKDPRVRSIRITGSWRGIVLAPDDGTETFLLLTVRQHDDAYDWAVKQKSTMAPKPSSNSAP